MFRMVLASRPWSLQAPNERLEIAPSNVGEPVPPEVRQHPQPQSLVIAAQRGGLVASPPGGTVTPARASCRAIARRPWSSVSRVGAAELTLARGGGGIVAPPNRLALEGEHPPELAGFSRRQVKMLASQVGVAIAFPPSLPAAHEREWRARIPVGV